MEYQSGRKSIPAGRLTGSFSGNGRTNPTQNLVDAYEMSNGKRIDENGSTYDAANPYKDRDPRLAQTLFYQGMNVGTCRQRRKTCHRRTLQLGCGQRSGLHLSHGRHIHRILSEKFVN